MVYKKNPFSTPFLSGYKILKIPLVNANGESAWPELFPPERIEQMRQTVGMRAFSAQMMLDFVSPERIRLDPGGIHFYSSEFDVRNARLCDAVMTGVVLYWDPSTGRRNRDGSACVLLYRDDSRRTVYIHDILYLTVSDNEQFPLSNQCDQVLDFMHMRGLRRITIETNGLGGGLPEIMRDCATRRGEQVYVTRVSNTTSKSDRILNAIEPLLSTGRLYAHTRTQQTPLISEMIGWVPTGGIGHDDGLDAVAGAIAQTPVPVYSSARAVQTFAANTNFSV